MSRKSRPTQIDHRPADEKEIMDWGRVNLVRDIQRRGVVRDEEYAKISGEYSRLFGQLEIDYQLGKRQNGPV